MSEMHNLLFSGEILPGHEPQQVRDKVSALFRLTAQQCEQVFSGRRVILKRDLAPAEVGRYVAHLEKIGIRVAVEPPLGGLPELEAMALPVSSPAAPPPPAAAAVEEMACPKCGERQPKRTLCRACATDMPRFLAAQEEAKAEARAVGQEAADSRSGSGSPGQENIGNLAGGPPWVGFSFQGRMGRLTYLWSGSLLTALIVFGITAAIKLESFALGGIILLAILVPIFRLVVLRCHDVGWSGWLALLCAIPYLGELFSFVLMFIPGKKGTNAHGPQPGKSTLGAAAVGIASAAITVWLAIPLVHQLNKAMADRVSEGQGFIVMAEAAAGRITFAADNHVIFYSGPNCPCAEVREMLEEEGIRTSFYDIGQELSDDQIDALWKRLEKAGIPTNPTAMPIVEVNGTLMTAPKTEAIYGLLRVVRQ